MEWLDKMNAALNYIEDNLAGEINYTEAAKRACSSSYNFQRMFSFIADVPLAEYIRRRRLTLAALDFQKGGESVLDISLKYGYDSPVSFARAFQNLHGVTPKEAREKGVLLTLYPKISFKITIKGVDEMKYRIEKVQGFRLAGAVKSDAPLLEGMKELIIEEQEYVKFECRGKLPETQQNIWKRLYTEWFPNSGYEHAEAPDLEWYSEENMDSDSYLSEIWIPIKKSK